MHRRQLLAGLAQYAYKYPDETSVIKQFANFVKEQSECFQRTLTMGHVTGSAWLLSLDLGSVLLTEHKKLGKWLQLGGHADGEANVLKVALKEAVEESGIHQIEPLSTEIFDLDIHPIPENKSEKAHLHFDVRYLFKVKLSEAYKVSSESKQLAWVPLNNIKTYSLEDSILRMAHKSRYLLSCGF